MESTVLKLEQDLKNQLNLLADQIRKTEDALIRTKEGYLKVQGALEIIELIKKEATEEEARALATGEI